MEERLASLEQTLELGLDAAAAEARSTVAACSSTVALCTASERRCLQHVEALRAELAAAPGAASGGEAGAPGAVAELPTGAPRARQVVHAPQMDMGTVDGMICAIADQVIERVQKETRVLKDQYRQMQTAVDELARVVHSSEITGAAIPTGASKTKSRQPSSLDIYGESDLHSIVEAVAADLQRLRQQRNLDLSEIAARFEGVGNNLLYPRALGDTPGPASENDSPNRARRHCLKQSQDLALTSNCHGQHLRVVDSNDLFIPQ